MENEKKEQTTTLGEHRGLWLAADKTVRFKPWKGLQEAEMSKMLKKNSDKLEGGKVCKKVSLMLSYMCTEIAGAKFWEETENGFVERMTQGEREKHISEMYETDVLTAFMLMRMACIDDHVSMRVPSPFKQGRTCHWTGDLSQLVLSGPTDPSEAVWRYDLTSPAKMRGKAIVRALDMGPSKWKTSEQIEFEDPSNTNLLTIAGAIKGSPQLDGDHGHKVEHFYERDLYDVTKKDLSRLAKGMEENHTGLNLSIEVLDEEEGRNGRTFLSSVPWIYPDFFEDSSQ